MLRHPGRKLAAALVAIAVLVTGLPNASASQAELDKARSRANAAAAELARAETHLSNVQGRLVDLEKKRQQTVSRLHSLQGAVREVAVEAYIRGRLSRLPADFDVTDVSASTRAETLAAIVASGTNDTVDAYRAAAQDLDVEEARLASTRKASSDALAAYRKRASAAAAQLNKMKGLEAERMAREKAQRAAAGASARRPGHGLVLGSGNWICPVQGPRAFSDDYGDPRGGGRRRHQGNDILSPRGTPVVAPVDGSVKHHENGLGGHSFYLAGADGVTYYGAHLDGYTDNVGNVVAGTVIGYVGNTGDARGGPPHLHFEVHPGGGGAVNPYPTLRAYC